MDTVALASLAKRTDPGHSYPRSPGAVYVAAAILAISPLRGWLRRSTRAMPRQGVPQLCPELGKRMATPTLTAVARVGVVRDDVGRLATQAPVRARWGQRSLLGDPRPVASNR